MATIKGIWVFNSTIDTTATFTEYIALASNGELFHFSIDMNDGVLRYEGISSKWVYGYNGSGWRDEGYRTVDFGNEQTVSDTFYTWLTANATQQKAEPTLTFDPATLNLAPGTYSITITAVSKDKAESLACEPISYTVQEKVETPTIEIEGDTLKLYSDNANVTGFKILVDGVVKETVGVSNFTLSDDSTLLTSDGQTFNITEE